LTANKVSRFGQHWIEPPDIMHLQQRKSKKYKIGKWEKQQQINNSKTTREKKRQQQQVRK
jgi:hypothetical protein